MVTVEKSKAGKNLWKVNGKRVSKKAAINTAVADYSNEIKSYLQKRVPKGDLTLKVSYLLQWKDGSAQFKSLTQPIAEYNEELLRNLKTEFSKVTAISYNSDVPYNSEFTKIVCISVYNNGTEILTI